MRLLPEAQTLKGLEPDFSTGVWKTAGRSRLLMVETSINGLSDRIARGWPNVKFDSTPHGSFGRGGIDTGCGRGDSLVLQGANGIDPGGTASGEVTGGQRNAGQQNSDQRKCCRISW